MEYAQLRACYSQVEDQEYLGGVMTKFTVDNKFELKCDSN
jgi:hypothetical protein